MDNEIDFVSFMVTSIFLFIIIGFNYVFKKLKSVEEKLQELTGIMEHVYDTSTKSLYVQEKNKNIDKYIGELNAKSFLQLKNLIDFELSEKPEFTINSTFISYLKNEKVDPKLIELVNKALGNRDEVTVYLKD